MVVPMASNGACQTNRLTIVGAATHVIFTVEIADTAQARAQGLMYRKHMPKFTGMLFVYNEPQSVSFWMKNTYIPLDMLFINEFGIITKIHKNAQPHNLASIFGGNSVFAVLEINGGIADKLGIQPGDVVQHPAFDSIIAQLPCKK